MAQQPITIVWGSTTSNIITITPTDQGNGIVYESDIVSNFLNGALSISTQAIRNLQVMGGYYNAGQQYKQYQFCSQLCYENSAYQLNFYMATQDNPSLAPTNASSSQTGTTDMVLPINPTSTQTGWQQINLVPNQANIAYKNQANTFTANQTFNQPVYFNSTTNLNGNTTIGDSSSDTLTVVAQARFNGTFNVNNNAVLGSSTANSHTINGMVTTNGLVVNGNTTLGTTLITSSSISARGITATFGATTVSSLTCSGTATFSSSVTVNGGLNVKGNAVLGDSASDSHTINGTACFTGTSTYFAPSPTTSQSVPFIYTLRTTQFSSLRVEGGDSTGDIFNSFISLYASAENYTPAGSGASGTPYIAWATPSSFSNSMFFISQTGIKFYTAVTIQNASFGVATFALDPVWEQDYATANYVNQKLQELYDYLDARISTIEDKLGIPKVASLSRGITPREAINEIAVPQSTIKQLFDRIEAMEGYNGVLGYSSAEERMEISKLKNDESAIMEIVDKIKARKEREEEEQRQREEQEKAELEAQNQQ